MVRSSETPPKEDLAGPEHGITSVQIGKYTIEGILGRGGMGVVYKAVDPQIGRYVATKMIISDGDQSLLERFRSEADVKIECARCSHPPACH